MNTYAIRSALIRAFGVALALASGSVLATSFRLTDLGTLGGTVTQGVALNDAGQVTGGSSTPRDAAFHAFVWDGTRMQDLGTLGGTTGSVGIDLNDSGQVTGFAVTTGDEASHAFLWDGTTMVDLGTLGGVVARALHSTPRGR
jgi:probable HAF family extracellular repeat protein